MLGYLSILVGVVIFGGTVPMTKLALTHFSFFEIASFRIFIGGCLALKYLAFRRTGRLTEENIKYVLLTAVGLVGFPFLLSHALERLPATFGSVAIGLLPLVTGFISVKLYNEKVKKNYYLFAVFGSLTVAAYSFNPNVESFYHLGIFALAVLVAAVGYASGSELAKRSSGPLAVSLAMAFVLPWAAVLFLVEMADGLYLKFAQADTPSVLALVYLGVLSQYVGFFPFYAGLSKVGTAKGIQVQLLQPFFSLLLSAVLLSEWISPIDVIVMMIVIGCIYAANRDAESENQR